MQNLIKLIGVTFFTLLLASCASINDVSSYYSSMGVIKEEKNLFDGSKVIELTPSWLFNPLANTAGKVKLGGFWTDRSPNEIGLVMVYDSSTMFGQTLYLGMTGMDINIEGKVYKFQVGASTAFDSSVQNTAVYAQSKNIVTIPYELLKKMLISSKTLIRIYTSKGFEDSDFSIEYFPDGKQGTAILSFREFFKKLEEIKK